MPTSNRRVGPSALVVLALLVAATGCVSVRPIEPGAAFELEPDEGILVVDLESNAWVASLFFGRARAASDLRAGRHLRLLAVTAGEYRWTSLSIGAAGIRYRLRHEDFAFRVSPGRISYPGRLELAARVGLHALDARVVNRSAEVARDLAERYAILLQRYPPLFSGTYRDDFLERFADELPLGEATPSGGSR